MAIDMTKTLTSVAVGVVDEVLERNDKTNNRIENFKKWSDIGRLGLAAIGYGIQVFMPRYERIGEGLALSSTPLLVKTVSHVVAKPAAAQVGDIAFVPRRQMAPAAPVGVPVGAPVGRSYQPEFKNTAAW